MLRESSVHIGVCGKEGMRVFKKTKCGSMCVINLYKLKWVYGMCVCI